jgi:hypothetical protein
MLHMDCAFVATAEFDMSPSVTKVEYSNSDADLQGWVSLAVV